VSLPSPFTALLVLFGAGAIAGAVLAPRFQGIPSARLVRWYLVAVATLMAVRVAAYVGFNVFGIQGGRPSGIGPYDLTNVLVGSLYGFALASLKHRGIRAIFDEPELLLAMRVATGVAFILAGLGTFFFMERTGNDPFIAIGYTHRFHLFIMTAEILCGAALLLPWRWLTLVALAGLTIDMSGAFFTHVRFGDSLNGMAPAITMVLRLAALALLTTRGRWIAVAVGTVGCVVVALVGASFLLHTNAP
jgi:uncharacterized membrane protein YphA (DoxX/SURF4 family)